MNMKLIGFIINTFDQYYIKVGVALLFKSWWAFVEGEQWEKVLQRMTYKECVA